MKKGLSYLIIGLLFSTCSVNVFRLTDLRTEISKTTLDDKKARDLLNEMIIAHNAVGWNNINTYSIKIEDEFFGMVGRSSHPYREDKVELLLEYIPHTYDGRLTFLTGRDSGLIWGLQSWKTYQQKADSKEVFTKNNHAEFWIPTYQYFIEFPDKIQSATHFTYAGKSTIKGKVCDGILASWNSLEPQKDIDQYLIWIDEKTKQIVMLAYTIRDKLKWIKGAAYFENYKNYDGIVLPATFSVESNLMRQGLLHKIKVLDFTPNLISKRELRPDSTLPTTLGNIK